MNIFDPKTGEMVVIDFQEAKERLRPTKPLTYQEKVDQASQAILKQLGLLFVVDDDAISFKHDAGKVPGGG